MAADEVYLREANLKIQNLVIPNLTSYSVNFHAGVGNNRSCLKACGANQNKAPGATMQLMLVIIQPTGVCRN
jgi:hypothetical protein